MSDTVQNIEDLIERLVNVDGAVRKLKTASVSGTALRKRAKDIHKDWLPVCGILEQEQILDSVAIEQATNHLEKLKKLADGKSPKAQYKALLKTAVSHLESEVLHPLIKRSGLKTVGSSIRAFIAPINDSVLLTYLDESVRCAEQNCVRASIVLAWCAVASKVHTKLLGLGLPDLEVAFDKMKQDTGMMFRTFTKTIKLTTTGDIQEVPDANLILLCRFLMWLDDSEYKQLKGALDLRNSCGHPTNYQPDSVKLQAYYADITQLVLLNPKFV
jgi:hypothetical protein